MGIRQTLNERKGLSAVLTAVVLIGALVAIVYQYRQMMPGSGVPEVYFTTDEGQNLFSDSATRRAPFERAGVQAARAHVFQCDGKQYVAYLERYTPEAQRILEEAEQYARTAKKGDPPPDIAAIQRAGQNGREVKRPGEGKWVSVNSKEGVAIVGASRTCPPGLTGMPERMDP